MNHSKTTAGTRPKLALFIPDLAGGGAQMVMLRLAGGFAERGVDVDLVLAAATGPCLEMVPGNVRLIDFKVERTRHGLLPLAGYLSKERPVAILSTLQHANIVALCARRLSRAPTRVVIREATTPSAEAKNSSMTLSRMRRQMARCCYRWSTGIVAVSEGVADDMVDYYRLPREQITVIYNPVDINEIRSKGNEPVAHPWFAATEPPVVLGVGRLTTAKDYPTLLRAFALVRQTRDARLVILGEGENRAALEELVKMLGLHDVVDLPGFVGNPIAHMTKAAVYVLSSVREGMPNTLIQAMAAGCHVVATDCPSGPREVLDGGRLGRLVPMGDVAAIAQAIDAALASPIGPSSPSKVEDSYCHSTVIDQYLGLLMTERHHG